MRISWDIICLIFLLSNHITWGIRHARKRLKKGVLVGSNDSTTTLSTTIRTTTTTTPRTITTITTTIIHTTQSTTSSSTIISNELDRHNKGLGYNNESNGNMGNKKCIKWGTIPSKGLLSDYYLYVGVYIHPRQSKEYVPLFDGILLDNNIALTNVMFNSKTLSQIQQSRTEGYTLLNAVNYRTTPDVQNIRFIYDAINYDEWLNDVNDMDKFQGIPSQKNGVQLALVKLNQSYDIDVKVILLARPLQKADECVVFTRSESGVKTLPIKMYSMDECKQQQPEYEEGTCFTSANEEQVECYIKPGAPIYCSGFLAGIVRWTDNCSDSKLIPYADIYKYHQWIIKKIDQMQKIDCRLLAKKAIHDTLLISKGHLKASSLLHLYISSRVLFLSYILQYM